MSFAHYASIFPKSSSCSQILFAPTSCTIVFRGVSCDFSAQSFYRNLVGPSELEELGLEATETMQDLFAIFCGYGGLLVGYGALLLAYFMLRREAQRNSGIRTFIQIHRWELLCLAFYTGLFSGALLWTIWIGTIFAYLEPELDQICPGLMAPDDCPHAALDWRLICILLAEIALAAFIVIVYTIRVEARRTVSPLERPWLLLLLTWSHCLLVISWLLCTPLTYPLKLFSLTGTSAWTRVSSGFAAGSIAAYTFGTALWIIALLRLFYKSRQNRTADRAQWLGGLEEHARQEVHELETLNPVVPVERV